MTIPVKLEWGLSGLLTRATMIREMINMLVTAVADGSYTQESLSSHLAILQKDSRVLDTFVNSNEQWIKFMDGEPMPIRGDGANRMFKLEFEDGTTRVVTKKKEIRRYLDMALPIRSIRQSEYSWQHCSLEEMKQYAIEDMSQKNKELIASELVSSTLNFSGVPYRCPCGCNVFHKVERPDLPEYVRPTADDSVYYKCNACPIIIEAEEHKTLWDSPAAVGLVDALKRDAEEHRS